MSVDKPNCCERDALSIIDTAVGSSLIALEVRAPVTVIISTTGVLVDGSSTAFSVICASAELLINATIAILKGKDINQFGRFIL
jgi:hypothetical protein